MSIRAQIEERLKQARRERDEATKNVIGMLKNKVLIELKAAAGRVEDDALWIECINAYVKQLRKSLVEFDKAGERAAEAKAEALSELAFCEGFLPKKLDEAETEAIIRELAAAHGVADAKQMGKLMGLLMKDHRDTIDGDLARKIMARVLT